MKYIYIYIYIYMYIYTWIWGDRTPKRRIHAKCSDHLSYKVQTFTVFQYQFHKTQPGFFQMASLTGKHFSFSTQLKRWLGWTYNRFKQLYLFTYSVHTERVAEVPCSCFYTVLSKLHIIAPSISYSSIESNTVRLTQLYQTRPKQNQEC